MAGKTQPLMGAADHINLVKAPKKSGTKVNVQSYDVISSKLEPFGYELQPWAMRISPDHMYIKYDDGKDEYIFRGGPKWPLLNARVDPSPQSPDYRKGERVLYSGELAGQTAQQAAGVARSEAKRLNDGQHVYLGLGSNSNTAVGDVTERQLGRRIGDRQTPGVSRRAGAEPAQIVDALFIYDDMFDRAKTLLRRRSRP